ncbi:MAG: hypothetical protein M3Y69_00225 [Verrucomicrobiota bacterium]|nr:hypothetical protein [Verrucomicrobiota bacterium]
MSPFDYAVGLVSILVGLALADVAASLHKLLRQGRSIRWDGRVILSVALVIVVITGMWFSVWSIRSVKGVLSFPFYLSVFLEFMVLFLVCAACLPDDAAENRDLKAFYEGNRRYLWTLFALFQTSFFLHWIYFAIDPAGSGPTHRGSLLVAGAMVVAPAIVFLLLAFIRARRFHYAALVALLMFYLYVYWRATLAV